jgi:predicted ATP-grasp superfamily ATP-dependent carboligase
LIVGASVRAAAWSAVRSGLRPLAIDQFGDLDLRLVADVVTWEALSREGLEPWSQAPFVGTLLFGRVTSEEQSLLERQGPLLGGIPGLAEPERWRAAVTKAGLTACVVWPRDQPPPPRDGGWMRKPLASGGGRGVMVWGPSATLETTSADEPVYYQERIAGWTGSAVFMVTATGVEFVGATEQLIGDLASGAPEPFAYGGNIAPQEVSPEAITRLGRAVHSYAREADLRGLVGVDFVANDAGLWPVEINPRYTASCELFEHLHGRPLLTRHLAAYGVADFAVEVTGSSERPMRGFVGKRIVYAHSGFAARPLNPAVIPRSPWRFSVCADLPEPGTTIVAGQPLCTVYARGDSPAAVRRTLDRRALRLRRKLGDRES